MEKYINIQQKMSALMLQEFGFIFLTSSSFQDFQSRPMNYADRKLMYHILLQ
jgi:hypothetical protein